MSTTQAPLPPLGKLSMIGIWVETVLYGVNCVVYTLCILTLLRGRKAPRWLLIAISTMLFLLCTGHVVASLQQLLEAFVYAPADVPDYSSTVYWLDFALTPCILKDVLYIIMGIAQHIIQIWRLLVVFSHDWKVVIVPIILLAGYVGSTLAAVMTTSLPKYTHDASIIIPLTVSAPVLDVAITMLITIAIVTRLCWTNWNTASLTGISTSRFTSSIYIVIESGAILATFSIAFLVLFVLGHSLALIGLDILGQLTVLVPMLIFIKVGQTGHHYAGKFDPLKATPVALTPDETASQTKNHREQITSRDIPLCDVSSRTLAFMHDPPV